MVLVRFLFPVLPSHLSLYSGLLFRSCKVPSLFPGLGSAGWCRVPPSSLLCVFLRERELPRLTAAPYLCQATWHRAFPDGRSPPSRGGDWAGSPRGGSAVYWSGPPLPLGWVGPPSWSASLCTATVPLPLALDLMFRDMKLWPTVASFFAAYPAAFERHASSVRLAPDAYYHA